MADSQFGEYFLGLDIITIRQGRPNLRISFGNTHREGIKRLQHCFMLALVHSSSSSDSTSSSWSNHVESPARLRRGDRSRPDTQVSGNGENAPLPPRFRVPPMNCSA